jgi:hypothetical protein
MTPTQFADALSDAVVDFKAGVTTEAQFRTAIDGLWTGTALTTPDLALGVSELVSTVEGRMLFGPSATIAAANEVNLFSLASHVVEITPGAGAITSFGAIADTSNPLYILRFSTSLVLVHNATTLVLPGSNNLMVSAGDTVIMEYRGTGKWQLWSYNGNQNPKTEVFLDSFSDVNTINAFLLTNQGSRVRVRKNPAGGPWKPNFFATGKNVELPADTILDTDGSTIYVEVDNPVRGFVKIIGSNAYLEGNWDVTGNYGPNVPRPVINWKYPTDQAEMNAWITLWNASHTPTLPTTGATTDFRDRWNAVYTWSPMQTDGPLSIGNRNAGLMSYNADNVGQRNGRLKVTNMVASCNFQGRSITAAEWFLANAVIPASPTLDEKNLATAAMQTSGVVVENLVLGEWVEFPLLAKLQRGMFIGKLTGKAKGWRINKAQPHVIYLSNEPTKYEASDGIHIDVLDIDDYEGGSVVKAKVVRGLTWNKLRGHNIHSMLALLQGSSGIGGDIIVTDQHESSAPTGAGVGYCINVLDCPGFVFGGEILISPKDYQDKMKAMSIEYSNGVRVSKGLTFKAKRSTNSPVIRFMSSDYCYMGKVIFEDSANVSSSIITCGDGEESGGGSSYCVFEGFEVKGTSGKLIEYHGDSHDNTLIVDSRKVEGFNPPTAIVSIGVGQNNVMRILDQQMSTSSVTENISGTKPIQSSGTATLELQRQAPVDPDEEQGFPWNFSVNEIITIDGATANARAYRFRDKTSLIAPYDVALGDGYNTLDAFGQPAPTGGEASMKNLARAILGSGSPGVEYATGTVAHPTVTAENTGPFLTVRHKTPGDIACQVWSTAAKASWSSSTLQGGGLSEASQLNHIQRYNPSANSVLSLPPPGSTPPDAWLGFEKGNGNSFTLTINTDLGVTVAVLRTKGDRVFVRNTPDGWEVMYSTPSWLSSYYGSPPLPLAGGTMTGPLTLSGDPSSNLHAATKQYVDNVAQGLDAKASVLCATTGNIALTGEQTIDNVTTSNSRVLVRNQTNPAKNGLYVSSSTGWVRATDMNTWNEVPGSFVFVEQGTLYGNTGWTCTADAGGTLETTNIPWVQFSAAGYHTSSNGIVLNGADFQLTGQAAALHNLGTNGFFVRTGTGTVAARTFTAPAAGFTITNNDGVAGNPTFVLADDLAAVEGIATTGFVRRTALNTWSAAVIGDADITGTFTGIGLKTNGVRTVFAEPSSGTANALGRVVNDLASYRNSSGSTTGAIVFTPPATLSSVMHQMRVHGLIHNVSIIDAVVQGYWSGGAWNNVRKINIGSADVQARWGVTPGGVPCLVLGDVGTSWAYPHISIKEALFSHSSVTDAYCVGWTTSLVTDLTGWTLTTVSNNASVGVWSGDGSALTALNATNISSGTLAVGRLPAFTGDVTASIGTGVLTIAAKAVGPNELNLGDTTNIVMNPMFTFDGTTGTTEGWNGTIATLPYTDAAVPAGAPSPFVAVKSVLTGSNDSNVNNATRFPVSPGEVFYYEFWACAIEGANSDATFGIRSANNANASALNPIVTIPSSTTSWTKFTGKLVIPATISSATPTTAFANFRVVQQATSPTGRWLFTDVQLRRATLGAEIADTNLNSLSGLTYSVVSVPVMTAAGTFTLRPTGVTNSTDIVDKASGDTRYLNATNLNAGTVPAARMPAFTGDATSVVGAVALTLATVNSNVGSFGSATQAATFTVNGKGLLTAAGNVTVTPAWSDVTGKPTTLSGYGITDAVPLAGGTMTGPLTLSGDPSSNLHAATKQYVDGLVQGLDVKASVLCATTGNITLTGEQTIDGVLTSNSRVLVKNHSNPAKCGIYVSGSGNWTRATDMDSWSEVPGAFVFVEQGTLNGNTGWTCTADAGGTLETTTISWVQFSAAGAYSGSAGLTVSGTDFQLTGQALALHNLGTNGFFVRTGAGTVAARSLTAPAAGLTITNNDGVAGNPTFALANDLAAVEGITGTGFARRTATDVWSASALAAADFGTRIIQPASVQILDPNNIIQNPIFSYHPHTSGTMNGWTGTGSAVAGASAPYTAPTPFVLQKSSTSSSDDTTFNDGQWMGVAVGDIFYYEFWACSSADCTGTLQFGLRTITTANNQSSNPTGTAITGPVGAWTKYSGFLTCSIAATYGARPYFRTNSGGVGSWFISNVKLYRAPFLGALNNYTVTQKIGTGTATTSAEYMQFVPTDYGSGKPRLAIQKAATATNWTIAVEDSVAALGNLILNTAQVRVPAGTVALPGLAFVTDSSTGFHLNASNNIVVSRAGSARFTFGNTAHSFYNTTGNAIITTITEGGNYLSGYTAERYFADNLAPVFYFRKARGTTAAYTVLNTGDRLGEIVFQPVTSLGGVTDSAIIRAVLTSATPGPTSTQARVLISTARASDNAMTEVVSFEHAVGMQMYGSTVINSSGHLVLKSYTVAAALLLVATAGQQIYVSDGTSNKRLAIADGTTWRFPDGAVIS